ncbi:hypothetical protein [Bacillus massiliigorillae]|uniref:hypothetical protein n=1 Tax=Bacillus massiliigorillae TaxID=1243664 RepID=UPI0003AAC16F|nr:hypothetical protein [Bacillus massiliigorillae]
MAIHTRGLVGYSVDVNAAIKVLKEKFNIQGIHVEDNGPWKVLVFEYGGDVKRLSIYENFKDQGFIGFTKMETVTLVEIDFNSHNASLVQSIVETFGGYYIENDYGDLWSYIEAV